MKFREIFRFELRHQLRRATTWLCFAVLFFFAFVVFGASSPADDVYSNSPFIIAISSVMAGVIWVLLAASVAGEAAARDVQTGIYPLTYTAPVSKAEYLGGRFLAAFVVNALMLLTIPLGMLLGPPLFAPSHLGPFRAAAYLTTYVFITLPFVFVSTAIQFSVAMLMRRAMASYLVSVFILAAPMFVLMTVAQLLGRWELVRLLDLVGIPSIIGQLGETLTPSEMNTRLLALDPVLLVNRLIWLGIAAAVLGFTWLRFRLAHVAEGTRGSRAARRRHASSPTPAAAAIATSAPILVPDVRRTSGFAMSARQTLGIAWDSFRAIAKSRTGLTLVALFALLLVVFMPENMKLLGVPIFPVTERVLAWLTAALTDVRTPLVIIPLLIAFYAGEVFWRERDAGLGDVADAAPVSEWALFLGKFLGLGGVIVAWLVLLATAGMLAQLAMGYRDLEPGLYLTILFGLQLPEYLLFTCLALAVHVVVNHKYAGHIVCIIALGFIHHAAAIGVYHNLLIYSASPEWFYTEMGGFGHSLGPWLWFKLYWAAWAMLLAVAARLLWTRGREGGVAARLHMARQRFTRRTAATAAVAVALIVTLGGFVFYNTNVLNEYETVSKNAAAAAEYERRYGPYEDRPQPLLAATKLHVEIYPERRAVEIRGTYRVVNRSTVPIDSIHIGPVPGVHTGEITFDRPAALVLADDKLGHRIYALAQPLQPGDSVSLSFDVRHEWRGFRNYRVRTNVAANGSNFGNADFLPALGYQPFRELRAAADRRKHGLVGPASFPKSLYDVAARYSSGGELIDFEAVVGTKQDQVAIAPGALKRTWTEAGRRYFHYATDVPIHNEYRVFSANYDVHEARWNDVAIEIFHHPGDTTNLDRMVRSIQASLTHFTAQFGPYPYRHIRFVERAGGEGGMSADASSVAYDEGFSHLNPGDPERGLDLPFYAVAHEVAHQWWGGQLASANVEGRWLMSETLAVYSGMQVLREAYGPDQLRRYLRLVRSIYAFPRSRAAVPLLRANESFLGYRKGAVAMYALSRYVGEDQVNGALRRLLAKNTPGVPPWPTSLDLYRELQAVTPDSLRYLLHDLFETNTYWRFSTEDVRVDSTAAGTWQVTLDVWAQKVVVDSAGGETDVPMNDWIEIGVFAPAEEGEDFLSKPLYVQLHRIRSGKQTITVTVPRKPLRAGIDPYHLLIDLFTEDNVFRIKQSGDAPFDLI